MATVYILFSKKLDRYYVGSCLDFDARFEEHLGRKNIVSFTAKAEDWILYYKIDGLQYKQARNIEAHIKRMRSRKYIEYLQLYPEIMKKLADKFL